jgi:hypothetical protein
VPGRKGESFAVVDEDRRARVLLGRWCVAEVVGGTDFKGSLAPAPTGKVKRANQPPDGGRINPPP